jgi:hypothetical protein
MRIRPVKLRGDNFQTPSWIYEADERGVNFNLEDTVSFRKKPRGPEKSWDTDRSSRQSGFAAACGLT